MNTNEELQDRWQKSQELDARFEELLGQYPTVEAVMEMVEIVSFSAWDDEAAHIYEDRLRRFALEAAAGGHPAAQAIAAIALTTQSIDFARWCA